MLTGVRIGSSRTGVSKGAVAACAGVLLLAGLMGAGWENDPPILEGIECRGVFGNNYVVDGYVTDEYPEECAVHFGGALAGYSALVGWDGYFCISVELGPYDGGPVTAQAVDSFDQYSNVVSTVVFTD